MPIVKSFQIFLQCATLVIGLSAFPPNSVVSIDVEVDFYPVGCEDNGITGFRILISVPKAKNGHPIPHISDVGSFMQLISNDTRNRVIFGIAILYGIIIACIVAVIVDTAKQRKKQNSAEGKDGKSSEILITAEGQEHMENGRKEEIERTEDQTDKSTAQLYTIGEANPDAVAPPNPGTACMDLNLIDKIPGQTFTTAHQLELHV